MRKVPAAAQAGRTAKMAASDKASRRTMAQTPVETELLKKLCRV